MSGVIRDLTADELRQFGEIIARLERMDFGSDVRGTILPDVVRLLRSDFGASYAWDGKAKRFGTPRAFNLTTDDMRHYDEHFRQRDPISQPLRARRTASFVVDVMSQAELEKTEFFNGFLAPGGLHHGINIYVFDGNEDLGDLRIWRSKDQPEFSQRDKDVLDTLEPFLRRALLRSRGTEAQLTARERDVASLVAKGVTDRGIADVLGISFATVRTHLSKAMEKCGCANRAELAAYLTKQPK